jgi:HTH domain of spoOJ/parA/parB/repB family protein
MQYLCLVNLKKNMPKVKPFRGLRPPKDLVEQVESRPYDVLNSEEARAEAGNNEKSLYHIIKPEINFPEGTSEYDPRVYDSAAEQFEKFQKNGWLLQDEQENYYLYAQTMNGKTQYGIVLCAHVDDYMNGNIKKHELTRRDKEDDRMKHVRITNANIEPVFLAFRHNDVLAELIKKYAAQEPVYHFKAPVDGFIHQFWVIDNKEDQDAITEEFEKMDSLYIADGHHRSAAAARVGAEKGEKEGRGEHDYYMAVCFPAEQLTILDYNRVVKDLNGLSEEDFLKALEKNFTVACKGEENYRPQKMHEFSLYVGGKWYSLEAKPGTFNENDPIGVLDVDISSRLILDEILNIKDLRSDKRIDFVGGLRGLGELKRRVDSGEMKMALALYPVSMQQIMDIADSGNIMPPKATWFEPKLRSGLVIHKLD